MAGLALGNAGAARFGNRVRNPVRMYAILEIVVGALGVGLVWLLPKLGPLLAPLFGPLLETSALVAPMRFAFGFVCLLGPAAAMGATLPLLVRALSRGSEDFGSTLGALYGWNTFGAVLGAVIGEMFLIGPLGVLGTAFVAGGMNLLAAAGAFAIARSQTVLPPLVDEPPTNQLLLPLPERALRLLGAAFLSGGILLGLQVVWFRMLLLFMSGTGRAFAVMLSVVLSGIALGSFLASAAMRRAPDADRHGWLVALAAGALTVLGFSVIGVAMTTPEFPRVAILSSPGMTLVTLLMLPTCVASGAMFTFFGKSLNDILQVPVRSAGLLTLANTIGAALGPLLAGFFLMPNLGLENSLFVMCALYGVVGLLAVDFAALRAVPIRAAAALVYVAALALFPFGRMDGEYIPYVLNSSLLANQTEVVASRVGLTETVHVTRTRYLDEPVYHMLITDGYAMSTSATNARRYMNLFVHLPVALHPQIEDALLISYGVGNTAKSLTRIDGVESIDIVDISQDILDMAEIFFPDAAENPQNDPRVDVHIEDGRYFLQTTDKTFDLITAEPPPPNVGNVTYLYTQEYFELAHDRLNPGGMVSYWLPSEQLQTAEVSSIIGAFCGAFEDCSLWNGGSLNWILLGSRGGLDPVTVEALSRQWQNETTREDLLSIGVESPEALGALFIADADQLQPFADAAPPVRDNYPLRIHNWVEPTGVRGSAQLQDTLGARKRFARSAWIRSLWPKELQAETQRSFRYTGMVEQAMGHLATHDTATRLMLFREVIETTDLVTLALLLQYGDPAGERIAREKRGLLPKTGHHEYAIAQGALARREWVDAAETLTSSQRIDNKQGQALHLALYAHCRAGATEQVDALRNELFGDRKGKTPAETLGPEFARNLKQNPGVDGCWAAAWDMDWQRQETGAF